MNFFEFRERLGGGVDEETEVLATKVIGAAIEVHRVLKPGLPESVYRKALSVELRLQRIPHECEVAVPIAYKGEPVGVGRVDLLVAKRLVVELKAVDVLNDIHRDQVVAYLQALNLGLGLLINFNVLRLRQGVKRILNTYTI